ncbi:MAG TPA: hypothetical protein VGC84_13545 [Ilumatobacteraceae bacterium]
MKPAGNVVYANLDLLDRQLRDRHGVLCGNVDDLELQRSDNGDLYVTAILAGAGALAYRMGRRRLGEWVHRASQRLSDTDADRGRIPMELVMDIGPAIDLAVEADDLATHDLERWTRQHITDHIPGHDRRANQ